MVKKTLLAFHLELLHLEKDYTWMLVKNIKHGLQEVLKDLRWCFPQVSETLGERMDYVDYVQLQKSL